MQLPSLVLGFCLAIPGQTGPEDQQVSPADATSVPIIPFGSVLYGDNSLQLFETTRNKVPNVYKRFAYEPAFAPELDAERKIAVKGPLAMKVSGPDGSRSVVWQVSFVLRFSTPELDELALYEVRAHLEGDRDAISPRNIRVWPIKWIQIGLPDDVRDAFPSVRLARSSFNMNTAKSVEVKLWFDDKETAEDAAARIDEVTLDLKYAQFGARTESNSVSITTKCVKDSGVYDDLKDLGTDIIHVRRSDIKELLARIRIATIIGRELENPAKFDQTLFAHLLNHWEMQLKTFDVDQFDKEMIRHTWKLKDLDPHSLTDFFKRTSRVDHKIVHVKDDAKIDTSGAFDYFGLFSAKGDLKASYTTAEFRDILRQRDILVQFEGEFVIPKQITLYSFHVGKLEAEFTDTWQDLFVSPPASITHLDVIRLGAWRENVIATIIELAALKTILAAEDAKVEATEWLAAAEASKQGVGLLDMRRYNTQAWRLCADGDEKLTAAKQRFEAASSLLESHKYEDAKDGYAKEAKAGFDDAVAGFQAAKKAYDEVKDHPKRDGRIYKIDYKYNVGKEDKESNTGMLVRLPVGDIHIDMGTHRSSDYSSPWMTTEGLNIPIQQPVSIEVGIKDGVHDSSCDVDGQFDLKVYYADDENRRWEASYSVPMTFYSTAGQGEGSSKARNALTVDRYQFAD